MTSSLAWHKLSEGEYSCSLNDELEVYFSARGSIWVLSGTPKNSHLYNNMSGGVTYNKKGLKKDTFGKQSVFGKILSNSDRLKLAGGLSERAKTRLNTMLEEK